MEIVGDDFPMLHAIDMRSESNTMTFWGSCELLDLCLLKIKHFPVTAGFETHRAIHLAALSAFRIGDVPIMAARNKDVRRERVAFGFHCRKLALNITYRRSESLQCLSRRAVRIMFNRTLYAERQ